jgi:hypothetical protein
MEICKIEYEKVVDEFSHLKIDLLDKHAIYYGCIIDNEIAGIVSYVEHDYVIYLCHDYVKEEYRMRGIYKLLCDYRESILKDSNKDIYAHCNLNSIKNFMNMGYKIDKALFKVIKSV